jgi:putative addiction module component (TIGR02574 family)
MTTTAWNIVASLSREQRLELLEKLWDSLAAEEIPITDELREELDRRLDDLDQNPDDSEPWEDLRERLRSRLK